jgi:hypothetical protein
MMRAGVLLTTCNKSWGHGQVMFSRAMIGRNPREIWDEFDPAPAPKPQCRPSLREGILLHCRARGMPRQRRRLKINPIEAIVVVIIIAVLVALLLPTGDNDLSHRYSAPASNAGVGFASLAGEYRLGVYRGGRGWCLSVLPDGRYSLMWSCCVGVGYRESGSVKRVGEFLVLSAAEATDESRMARIFRPVNWDCRTYLIPVEKFPDLIEAIVIGDEPRIGPGKFYVRGLDQPVTGIPDLPQAWAQRLRNRLVIGTVVEMLAGGRARIDRGTADGIVAGSELTVQGRDRFSNRKLKVVGVDERSCTVQHFYHKEFHVPLEVGWKVVAPRDVRHTPEP